jgi:hypothetical protein
MKKATLLIIFMIIFAFTAFAQIEVTVTGSSELVMGIALDDPVASGFTNTNKSKIAFSLGKGTSEKGAEADVYGWIKIKDWKADYNTDDAAWSIKPGSVEAKVMFPGGWVKISGTDSATNYALPVQDDDADKDNADKGLNSSIDKSGGLVLGLDFAPVSLAVGLYSENDWTQNATETAATSEWGWVDDDDDETTEPIWAETTTAAVAAADDINDEHAYGGSLKVTLDVAPVKVEAGVALDFNYVAAEEIGLGAKVTANVDPLTASAAIDVQLPDGGEALIEACVNVSVAIMDGVSVSADFSYAPVAVDNTDLRIKASAKDLVPGLSLSLYFELFNLMPVDDAAVLADLADNDNDAEWAVGFDMSFKTDTMKPYLGVRYGTYTVKDDKYTYKAAGQEPFKLNLGVDLTMIPNLTLTVDYNSDDLSSDTKSNGVIKLKAKIAY